VVSEKIRPLKDRFPVTLLTYIENIGGGDSPTESVYEKSD
jgi:hypothetical protein